MKSQPIITFFNPTQPGQASWNEVEMPISGNQKVKNRTRILQKDGGQVERI
jgi:hypothetical protein